MVRNLLELVPVANFPAKKTVEGLLRVEIPKFKGEIGKRFCRMFKLGEIIGVKLDEIGSFIYERCDGCRTVQKLLQELKEEFGERIEPALPRLRDFLGSLERNGLICYQSNLEA
jgi:hypothetical protein